MPEPLTAKKIGLMRSQSTSSTASYPLIPHRQSSLSASVSDGTNGPATSTRTPSLSDSLYQIQVLKIREMGARASRCSNSGDLNLSKDPFVDEIPRFLSEEEEQQQKTGNRYRPAPRLIVRWSSGSWDCSRPSLPSSSTNFSVQSRPLTPKIDASSVNSGHQVKTALFSAMDLPVAFVNVVSTINRAHIGMDPISLWATVQVSADVNSIPFPGISGLASLDIIILLDSLSQHSQITLGSSVLAFNLVHNHDRVALTYIKSDAQHGFEVLLPLGFHSFDTVRSSLNKYSRRQHLTTQGSASDLGDSIQQVTRMFETSPRTAFCHVFFVSATPPDHLSIPWIDPAIGFHTITPQACLPLTHTNIHIGWHIHYDVGTGDARPKESYFIRKVSRVIRQLRTGIRTGSILDPKLSVAPVGGCLIGTVIDSARLTSLRPGETWVVPVQISLPTAFQQTLPLAESPVHSPVFKDLLAQINELLQEYAGEITQPVLTAHVEYRHSLFPSPNKIHVETHLTVIRTQDEHQSGKENTVIIDQGEEPNLF
ncbi:uncharacterized protein N7482_006152 [Penicillium canariense]|uniref:Uncharacterized protein n=1 Tax=Penicillium canariense TaxID=189055 RepID=A0A9W9I5F6_9EURO|nr:uncharacterized protein N7482_006152 [Penicillium canariense]KAJ5167371.1 hypothetical protein N7482_006152 [Penicillium canariense]